MAVLETDITNKQSDYLVSKNCQVKTKQIMNLTLKKVSKFEEYLFLQQMVTTPPKFPRARGFFRSGEERDRGAGKPESSAVLRFVCLL